MIVHVAWLVLVAQLAQHQYEAENPACRDPQTVAPLCDEAFTLFETGVKVERERDTCLIDLSATKAKLENHTTPPPPKVVIEESIPTWVIVVGAVAVAVAFLGGAYAGLQLKGGQ